MVPTILAMAGVSDSQKGDFARRELPGKNLMPVLGNASSAGLNAAREGVLFTYSGLVANDADLIAVAGQAIAAGKSPRESMKASGFQPDLKKRGSLRTVFDGRYKFSRYFSPVQRNRPGTLDELYKANDVELFDLQTDQSETTNLAVGPQTNADLISTMSTKLEALIKAEIGQDDGREMPEVSKVSWSIDKADL
jgi:arylsulfatase